MNALARTVNKHAVAHGFQQLPVRTAYMESWYVGPGRLGATTPTREAWAEQKPEKLGAQISQLLADDETAIRLYAVKEHGRAIHRRVPFTGRFTGNVHTELRGGDPIAGAAVTAVTNVEVGRGRVLPLLTLIEFSPPPTKEFVVSVSDIAGYIQRGEVELVLA